MSGKTRIALLLVSLALTMALARPGAGAEDHGAAPARPAAPADTPVVANPFTVIVTAERQRVPLRLTPAATSVVDSQGLARLARGVAADEALAGVPGVRIDNQADGERVHISIRGQGVLTESGVRGIKVLMDGLPLNDPTGVAPDLFDVDWSTVERVEVLRGPAAAFYGGGGSGGVIAITTRDGGAAPAQGLASGEFGSYGFYKTLGEGGGTVGNANYRVSLSHAAADGWRQHTSFWSDNLYGKVHWAPSPQVELQQILAWTDHYEDNAEGLPRSIAWSDPTQANPDAIPKDEFYKVNRFTGGLTGRFGVAPGQALNLAAFFRTWKYLEPRPGEIIRRTFLAPGLSLQYDLDRTTGPLAHHLSVGGEAQWQSVDELRFENLGAAQQGDLLSNENVLQRSQAVFALDRVGFARDWTAMVAGRYDAIQNRLRDILTPEGSLARDFRRATGRAGLDWAPRTALSLYANVSTGFLAPATNELLNNPEGLSGFNQSLTYSTSVGEEVGARGLLPRALTYELALFALQTGNDIGRFRLPPSTGRGGIDFYRNVGDTRRFGAETRLGWKPARGISTELAYTWSRFKYVSPAAIDGNWLPSSPEHLLHLGADVEVTRQFSVGVTGDMQSHWWVDTQGLAWVPGFALWGAHASWQWRFAGYGGDVTFTAKNVFGAKYMAFTEPDFDDTGGIVVDVWNSYQPGPPQEYYVRVSVSR